MFACVAFMMVASHVVAQTTVDRRGGSNSDSFASGRCDGAKYPPSRWCNAACYKMDASTIHLQIVWTMAAMVEEDEADGLRKFFDSIGFRTKFISAVR